MQAGVGGGKNKANMCVSNVERTNERTNEQTNERTNG